MSAGRGQQSRSARPGLEGAPPSPTKQAALWDRGSFRSSGKSRLFKKCTIVVCKHQSALSSSTHVSRTKQPCARPGPKDRHLAARARDRQPQGERAVYALPVTQQTSAQQRRAPAARRRTRGPGEKPGCAVHSLPGRQVQRGSRCRAARREARKPDLVRKRLPCEDRSLRCIPPGTPEGSPTGRPGTSAWARVPAGRRLENHCSRGETHRTRDVSSRLRWRSPWGRRQALFASRRGPQIRPSLGPAGLILLGRPVEDRVSVWGAPCSPGIGGSARPRGGRNGGHTDRKCPAPHGPCHYAQVMTPASPSQGPGVALGPGHTFRDPSLNSVSRSQSNGAGHRSLPGLVSTPVWTVWGRNRNQMESLSLWGLRLRFRVQGRGCRTAQGAGDSKRPLEKRQFGSEHLRSRERPRRCHQPGSPPPEP